MKADDKLNELDILILESTVLNECSVELLKSIVDCAEESIIEPATPSLVAH